MTQTLHSDEERENLHSYMHANQITATQSQRTTRDQRLMLCLILSQLQVYCIDEMEKDNDLWRQDMKALCKKLSALIIKKHGHQIAAMFNVDQGQWIAEFNNIVDATLQNMAQLGIIQFGALQQFTEMLMESPEITMAEDEKDRLIQQLKQEVQELKNSLGRAL